MSFNKTDNKNLLLNQIIYNDDKFKIQEFVPKITNNHLGLKIFTNDDGIKWTSLKSSDNIIITKNKSGELIIDASIVDPWEGTEVHFKDGRMGIGGLPIMGYKVDIRVPENTLTTALHIGDGTHGFSMGNATSDGFLPQLIGLGASPEDAGFYILGKTSVDIDSGIPAIILDGRNSNNFPLSKRPILGISSGSYSNFKLLIDAKGRVGIGKIPEIYKLEVEGILQASNLILDSSNGTLNLIKEINELKARIKELELK